MKRTVVSGQWSVVSGVAAAALCGWLMVSAAMVAQAPAANPPQRAGSPGTPNAISPQRAGSPGAPNAMGRPADANSPAQAGRQALYVYLDGIAAQDEAARAAAMAKIRTRGEAELRQQEVRTKILELMGGGLVRTPLNAKVVGTTQMAGFRIEKVVYESQPGFYVTALLYVPDSVTNTKSGPQGLKPGSPQSANGTAEAVPLSKAGAAAIADPTHAQTARMNGAPDVVASGKLPAVVMAPGHAASGKAGDYAMAATFARNGFVVLSYDPIGQGERLQYPDPAKATAPQQGSPYLGASLATRPTGEHGEAGLQPTLIGDAVARYFLWDGMRAVDYLISRPEVDAEKIGAFGCSGGGAMTALLGAMDKRVKATATACYLTTMDALLPSVGAQDAEQSIPGFIASGFDFADWVELAAPRAYAMVGTVSDMFPWKGFLATATEARKYYGLFDARAVGVSANANAGRGDSGKLSAISDQLATPATLPTPTGPTLNPDTANVVGADSPFQVIAGIGGHGNLRPITAQIVGFFLVHLAGRSADSFVADAPTAAGASPFALPDVPKGALQVTATGQVATSYPGSETVFSLNLKRAKEKLPQIPVQTLLQVQTDVREVTEAEAVPGASTPHIILGPPVTVDPAGATVARGAIETEVGISLQTAERRPAVSDACNDQRHPATVMLGGVVDGKVDSEIDDATRARMVDPCRFILWVLPRPSPAGGEETKSPILGPFYMTELRAELVGRPLLGMRVDDVIRAVDYLVSRPDVDRDNITVVASGHMGLVALHAAVLDKRIKHVTVDHVLESYRSLLAAPMPLDAPQDVLPGVLEKYDVPDLVRVLGTRVTATDWLTGTENLGGVAAVR